MALFRIEEKGAEEMPLIKIISETLRYISNRVIEKLKEEMVKKEKIRCDFKEPEE